MCGVVQSTDEQGCVISSAACVRGGAQGTAQARRASGALHRAGSPLGVFEAEPGTQRGVLSTVLRGGGSLVTPAVAGAAAPAGAVATVIRRDKPGARCPHTTPRWRCARIAPCAAPQQSHMPRLV